MADGESRAHSLRGVCEIDWVGIPAVDSGGEQMGRPSAEFKVAMIVASYATELASAHVCVDQIERVLSILAWVVTRLAHMQKRHNLPTTAQRLLAVEVVQK